MRAIWLINSCRLYGISELNEYGGSAENRMRFATEIVQSIKQAVDLPVIFRIALDHLFAEGRSWMKVWN